MQVALNLGTINITNQKVANSKISSSKPKHNEAIIAS